LIEVDADSMATGRRNEPAGINDLQKGMVLWKL